MKQIFAFLFFVFISTTFAQAKGTLNSSTFANAKGIEFIENVGQYRYSDGRKADDILFLANTPTGTLYVRKSGLSFVLFKPKTEQTKKRTSDRMLENKLKPEPIDYEVCRTEMNFAGANDVANVIASEQADGYNNYYIGKTEYTNVHSYKKLLLKNVYENIDFVIYSGDSNKLEYDFVVKPGGNPAQIALQFTNFNRIHIDNNNQLTIENRLGKIQQYKPLTYQNSNSVNQTIQSNFTLDKNNNVQFQVGNYNKNDKLVIDPIVRLFGIAYGGTNEESGNEIKLDSKGNIYVVGISNSTNMPADVNQTTYGGGNEDAFVVKFDSLGKRLWSTYYGGNGDEIGYSIDLDKYGNVYFTGNTSSTNLKLTIGQKNFKGVYDVFITKLTTNGTLVWSTLFGGKDDDRGYRIVVDDSCNSYITGYTVSPDLNVTITDTKNSQADAFVLKLDSLGSLVWSRYFGGTNSDIGYGIRLNNEHEILISGLTASSDFKAVKPGSKKNSGIDAYLAKLSNSGGVLWTTFWGGNNDDKSYYLDINDSNEIVISGQTSSSDINANIINSTSNRDNEAFAAKFDNNGNLIWSTLIGGSLYCCSNSAAINNKGEVFFGGEANTSDLPTNTYKKTSTGPVPGFLTKLNPDGTYNWSTYISGNMNDVLIGLTIDKSDNIFITGGSHSSDADITIGTVKNHVQFLYVLKLVTPIKIGTIINSACIGKEIQIPYQINYNFKSNNIFYALLSDKEGKFNNFTNIGQLKSNKSGTIIAVIPSTVQEGDNYRIQIMSDDSTYSEYNSEKISLSKSPNAKITGNTSLCANSLQKYTANVENGISLSWYVNKGEVVNKIDSSGIQVLWDSAGTGEVKLIKTNNKTSCTDTNKLSISILSLPVVTIDSLKGACIDDSPFQLSGGSPSGGFFIGDGIINDYFYPKNAGIGIHLIKYFYKNNSGCSDTAKRQIEVYSLPDKPVITRIGNELESNSLEGNQWYFNGNKLSSDTARRIKNLVIGKYTVTQTNQYGCTSEMSDVFDIINTVPEITIENIKIYPNPVEDELTISLPNQFYDNSTIKITNLLGEEIYSENLSSTNKINVKNLAYGIYQIDVFNDLIIIFGGLFVKK